MLAVMYGCTPIITIESVASPPPAKMLSKPRNWLLETKLARSDPLIDGIGIIERMRVIANIKRTKKILSLIDLSEKTDFIYLNMYLFDYVLYYNIMSRKKE